MTYPHRIMVTGASGFVGYHLMPALRAAFPSSVLIACSLATTANDADLILPLDLLDERSIEDCLAKAQPDAIVHLAAEAFVADSFADPGRTWRVNLGGSLLIAQMLMRTAPETLLVFASSAETYGLTFKRGIPLDESAPFAPASPYAASKAAADLALGEMALRGLRVIRMRPANHTGPGQSDKFVVPAFARQLALIEAGRQEPVLRVGALDRWRDFLDVRDVCAAYVAALRCGAELQPGTAINIGSGIARRIGDILDAMVAAVGLDIEVKTDEARLRPTDILTVACDASRARALLGWAPMFDWGATLNSVLVDWRNRIG